MSNNSIDSLIAAEIHANKKREDYKRARSFYTAMRNNIAREMSAEYGNESTVVSNSDKTRHFILRHGVLTEVSIVNGDALNDLPPKPTPQHEAVMR